MTCNRFSLSEIKPCIYTHTYPYVNTLKLVAIPRHASKAQYENESQKKGIWKHIIKHFFLPHIAAYKYDRLRETSEYGFINSTKAYKEWVIMTSFFLLYIENKFCFFVEVIGKSS